MPNIIIHLSQQQLEELLQKNEIIINYRNPSATFVQGTAPPQKETSFFEFFKVQIRRLQKSGNLRTLETYKAAFRKFHEFMQAKDTPLSHVTEELLDAYQVYLREQCLAMNTVSFYMRILRAVYHRAVEQGLVTDSHPFRHVYTGIAKTSKRAISLDEMKVLNSLTIAEPKLQFARDMFLFSFYTRGMSFVDMAYLKKADIKNGVMTYKRHKTGQYLTIRWEGKMQDIVNRYTCSSSEFLLPLIHTSNGKERNQYRNIQSQINHDLKEIGKRAGINRALSMYCARHSWASIARQLKMPIEVISRGMGHTNQKTTEIYLKSIDINIIDEANSRIINSI
ncbi:MAG: site-specific integrase [Prevotella sp.]|nr:site-specific integrase [Prevotella sp.]